jgi:antirestriction protein ArdC
MAAKKTKERFDVYQMMTDRVLERMEQGIAPWKMPWQRAGLPRNLTTNKPYRGFNLFSLGMEAAINEWGPYWLTFKQASALGGRVKKGSKSTPVIFWRAGIRKDKKDLDAAGEPKSKPFMILRYFRVFNLDQCEDVRIPKGRFPEPGEPAAVEVYPDADEVFGDYVTREGIKVQHGGDRAFFRPATDSIQLPYPSSFTTSAAYHCTSFHEAAHSTGVATRLDRKGIVDFDYAGSHQYAEEELVAEFAATMLCGVTGIVRDNEIENSAAYLRSWATRLKEDPKLVVMAAQRAQRAADFVLGAEAPTSDSGDE